MIFVRWSISRRKAKVKEKDDLIEAIEGVVINQDKLLGEYRKMLK
jgi:hypothetical protein